MEESSSPNNPPSPWASPGYTPPATEQPPVQMPPEPGYGAPTQAPGYGAPTQAPGHSAPPPSYAAPDYAAPPSSGPGYATPGYRTPSPTYGAPGPGYESALRTPQTAQGNYTFPSLQKQSIEPLAIASVITSPIAPVGLGLGIVARQRIKKTLRRGQALATTGIIISSLFLIASLLAVGTFVLDGTFARLTETPVAGDVPATRTGSPVNLDIGNCVVTLPVTSEVGEVTLTPCAEDHQLQVIARTLVNGGAYEGAEALHVEATGVCQSAFDRLGSTGSGSFIPWHLVPSEANWDAGERNIICFARSTAGPVTVDLLG